MRHLLKTKSRVTNVCEGFPSLLYVKNKITSLRLLSVAFGGEYAV